MLTPRNREVAACLLQGLTDKEIAKALNMAVRTVKAHMEHIKFRLGLLDDSRKIKRVVIAMELHRRFPELCPSCKDGHANS